MVHTNLLVQVSDPGLYFAVTPSVIASLSSIVRYIDFFLLGEAGFASAGSAILPTSAARASDGFSAPLPGGLTPILSKLLARPSIAALADAPGKLVAACGGDKSVLGEIYDAISPLSGRRLEVGAAGENGAKVGMGDVRPPRSAPTDLTAVPGTWDVERG